MESIINYDFPKGNPDPFTKEFNGNFFVDANGYSNLSKHRTDFTYHPLAKHIPMGYKSIIVCHRLILIENGEMVQNWKFSEEEQKMNDNYSGRYYLSSDIEHDQYLSRANRKVESHTIYKPYAADTSISAACWGNLEECKQRGLYLSKETNCKMLISIILDTLSWH